MWGNIYIRKGKVDSFHVSMSKYQLKPLFKTDGVNTNRIIIYKSLIIKSFTKSTLYPFLIYRACYNIPFSETVDRVSARSYLTTYSVLQ